MFIILKTNSDKISSLLTDKYSSKINLLYRYNNDNEDKKVQLHLIDTLLLIIYLKNLNYKLVLPLMIKFRYLDFFDKKTLSSQKKIEIANHLHSSIEKNIEFFEKNKTHTTLTNTDDLNVKIEEYNEMLSKINSFLYHENSELRIHFEKNIKSHLKIAESLSSDEYALFLDNIITHAQYLKRIYTLNHNK